MVFHYLSAENKVVIPKISNPDDQTKLPIPLHYNSMSAEYHSLAPVSWSRQFRKYKTNHESLNEASKHCLEKKMNLNIYLINVF